MYHFLWVHLQVYTHWIEKVLFLKLNIFSHRNLTYGTELITFSQVNLFYIKKRTFGWLVLAILRINVSYTWTVNQNNIHIPTCTHTASCSLLVHILLGANMFGTRCNVSDRSMEPDSMRFMSTYGYLYINYANRNRRLFYEIFRAY